MKANCMECWYGGSGNREKNRASCNCEKREDRESEYCETFKRNRFFVNTQKDFDIECEYFTLNADCNDIELEPVTDFTLSAKCPYCGHEQVEYGKSGEGKELLECDKCEKKFGVYWCIY